MPTSGTTTTKTKTAQSRNTQSGPTRRRTDAAVVREGLTKVRNGTVSYVQKTSARAVDVPVGAALTAADRVTEVAQSLSAQEAREKELKGLRQRVQRELSRFERRGGGARRKARTRARQARGRAQRRLVQQRREVANALKENRARVEDGVKRAQNVVQDRVSTLV
jgi:hypothetical protein